MLRLFQRRLSIHRPDVRRISDNSLTSARTWVSRSHGFAQAASEKGSDIRDALSTR